ncbi:MAG: hypothetical protein ACRDQZ_13780, partial [Mycobacteriales bacterium]
TQRSSSICERILNYGIAAFALRHTAGMLDAPLLQTRKLEDRLSWYVLVDWLDGGADHVGDFATEARAQTWIERASAQWVERTRRRRATGNRADAVAVRPAG